MGWDSESFGGLMQEDLTGRALETGLILQIVLDGSAWKSIFVCVKARRCELFKARALKPWDFPLLMTSNKVEQLLKFLKVLLVF